MEWEQIDDKHQRANVFGGWLVKVYEDVSHVLSEHEIDDGWDYRVAMTFVPDKNHEWEIKTEEEK